MLQLGDASLDVLPVPLARPWGRSRERRAALARVIGSLAEHLQSGREAPTLAACFEAALRDALRAQSVRLCESPPPYRSEAAPAAKTPRLVYDGRADEARRAAQCSSRRRWTPSFRWTPGISRCCRPPRSSLPWSSSWINLAPRRVAPFGVMRRPDSGTPPIIGSSSAMTTLRENIARVAATDFTVLVQGESGTGKELVARQLHQLSRRRRGPFVAVNCAALVESLLEAELFGIEDRTATGVRGRRGKFEHADGGTLFLDEVSDLAPSAQAKLLRAIQELVVERVGGHTSRRVDTRIVVATNKDLRELAAGGQFREDLFYRLSGVELHVPPLRARRQDIPELSGYFLSRYQTPRPLTLSAEAAEAMQIYDWPGNVRELERLIEGAVTLAASEWVTIGDLPPALRGDCAEALRALA